MTIEEQDYQQAVHTVAMCGMMLAELDLPKLLEAIERADTVGPMFHPTLWMQKSKAMHEDRDLLRAALPLRAFVLKAQELLAAEKAKAVKKTEEEP